MTLTVRPAWILLFGPDCAARLQSIADVAGEGAVHRVLSGKLRASRYAGLYLRRALDDELGRSIVCGLLDDLLQVQVIPVASPATYSTCGPHFLAGMQLAGFNLIDVLIPAC